MVSENDYNKLKEEYIHIKKERDTLYHNNIILSLNIDNLKNKLNKIKNLFINNDIRLKR